MLRIALVIGLLGAVGPFAIDMYLPALPTVAADLAASPQAVQLTLTAFFLAFGLASSSTARSRTRWVGGRRC